MSFTYLFPENFKELLVRALRSNGYKDIADIVIMCSFSYQDQGLAYYAGMKGDNWDKKALDFVIEGSQENIDYLKRNEKKLSEIIQMILRPDESGFLLRKINYFESDDLDFVSLPEETGETFEVLLADISDALTKNEPALVLDRMHTFSVKYIRKLCEQHDVPISDGKEKYALPGLVARLSKYYERNGYFESEFSASAMKMSISAFDNYNKIRNDKSYAHDNDVLNKAESAYVVKVVAATLTFIQALEQQW